MSWMPATVAVSLVAFRSLLAATGVIISCASPISSSTMSRGSMRVLDNGYALAQQLGIGLMPFQKVGQEVEIDVFAAHVGPADDVVNEVHAG